MIRASDSAPSRVSDRFLGMPRTLAADERGIVGPVVAALGVILVASAGLALDVGLYYVGNRNLRAATEAAALAAAMDPANAETRARAYLVSNGYDASVLQSVQIGRYCANIDLPPEERFDTSFTLCPGKYTNPANAVRLITTKPSRRFLTAVLGGENPIPDLKAQATAARIDEAGIEVTSDDLTVSNRLVTTANDLLGALIGVKLRLSSADIEAMMGANVDAGLFFDNLAQRAGQTGTYEQLTQGTYDLQDIALAAADATSDTTTSISLRTFATQAGRGYQVPLTGLFGLGVWKNMPVGEADVKPALRAGLNAYQLIAYAVEAGPGTIDLSDAVSLAVPGSTVKISALATSPASRPRFSFGPAGDTEVGTSMLRLQVQIGLGNISLLGDTVSVNSIPVLIDVAAASAKIDSIDCANTAEQARDTTMTVDASSGLVNAYIGEAPANAMTKPMPALSAADIQQANLINVAGLLTVDARAVAQPVMGNSGTLTFGPGGQGTIGSPDAPGTPVHLGNTSQVGPLITSLVDSISASDGLQVKILGLCAPLICDASESAVRQTLLDSITEPLGELVGTATDPILDTVLAALGIELGHATIWATGARCGVPVLV